MNLLNSDEDKEKLSTRSPQRVLRLNSLSCLPSNFPTQSKIYKSTLTIAIDVTIATIITVAIAIDVTIVPTVALMYLIVMQILLVIYMSKIYESNFIIAIAAAVAVAIAINIAIDVTIATGPSGGFKYVHEYRGREEWSKYKRILHCCV